VGIASWIASGSTAAAAPRTKEESGWVVMLHKEHGNWLMMVAPRTWKLGDGWLE
jgi:hypothetical protein